MLEWRISPGYSQSFADPSLPRPEKVLAGFDDFAKEFRTASAKEYPPQLCKALIETAFISLSRRVAQHGHHIVKRSALLEQELNWLAAVEATARTAFGHERKADYQPAQGS